MDVEMVFNELSTRQPAENIHIARQWMSKFIGTTIVATKKYDIKPVLRIEKNFFNLLLADNYPLSKWRNDPGYSVNRDEQRWLRNLETKYPVYVGFEDTQVEADYLTSTYHYQGISVYGLHFAYLLKALAVSLPSADQWHVSQVLLERKSSEERRLSGDIPETVLVHHASLPQHVRENADWIQERLEFQDPWLKHHLPKDGQYPYRPPKTYYVCEIEDFPTKIHRNEKVFIDHKDQLWLWDKQEHHWDVQYKPYGLNNYFRVTPDGRLLD